MNNFSKNFKERKDPTFRNNMLTSLRKRRFGETQQEFYSSQKFNVIEAVSDLTHRALGLTNQGEYLGKFTEDMEERDHYPLVAPPNLSTQKASRQKMIKIWLGDVARKVFSTSFKYFSSKTFDTQTTKSFCSQSFIGNILALSKKIDLTEDDFKLINKHLKKQVLPYFLLRYPQSNNKQVNQNLNKAISLTDAIDTNENNTFLKSEIDFQYRKDGFYYDLIMLFINYLIKLPDMKIDSTKNKKQKNPIFFDQFNQDMENLFKAVNNRQWAQTDHYTYYSTSQQGVETLLAKVTKLEEDTIKKKADGGKNISSEDKQYEDLVKSYTHYIINRKISKDTKTYSAQKIHHGNMKINSSTVLRIIVKWCSELEQKFEDQYYIDRDEPFVMAKKGEVDMNSQLRENFNEIIQNQWRQIQQFLSTIHKYVNRSQASLSFMNLMFYSDSSIPEFEQSFMKFAKKNTQDVMHYSLIYLNRLLHGLLNVSHVMYEKHLKGWAEWPQAPQLLTFTISDLMRCKCFSKEKQIIRIYKQLQIQSQIAPEKMRIVRVKNRLNRGTKDILINILYYETILCEIQLAIKVDITDFILYSDKFNHYIYELYRSDFGPINQMCSIWSSLDQRASFLKNDRVFLKMEKFHKCENGSADKNKTDKQNIGEQNLCEEILPFTCNICENHYSQSYFIFYHKRCNKCNNFWICALCRMNSISEQQLMKELSLTKDYVTRRIYHQHQIPQYMAVFRLQSAKIIGGTCRLFQVDKQMYYTFKKNGKLVVIPVKLQKPENFLQKFVVFELKEPDQDLAKLTVKQVMNYLVLEEIHDSYNKKYEALRIANRKITKQLLLSVNDPRGQQCMKNLSFPNNEIDQLKQIGQKFKNVRFLNLNNNGLKSIKGIGKMKNLSDVYLGENCFKEIVQLDQLTNLRYIQLGQNPEAPVINCDLSKLTRLESVTFITSNLTQFPQKLTTIQSLKLLWLFSNKIPSIPSEIGNLKNLEYLHLAQNQIQVIPPEVYSLVNLSQLFLDQNKIKQLSSDINFLTKLCELSLTYNQLTDTTFPCKQLGSLPKLKICNLDNNLEQVVTSTVQQKNLNRFYFVA